jgi:glucosamine--fructose-6-phosphate aminotransferase (isomerizing)
VRHLRLAEHRKRKLAHLVEDVRTTMPGAPWSQVVACALKVVEGAYGVVFMFQDDPDLLIRARKGSPLLLGVGDGENMLANDGSAVVEHTRDVVYVRDGERVVVRRDSYQIYLASEHALCGDPSLTPGGSRLATNPISRLEMSLGVIEKAGYPHFMLKEIMDQPNALRNAMRGRVIKMNYERLDWTD